MANVSDIIERFLMDVMGESPEYNFSRSELADRFDCVPSQINYVLSTRFTADRGYAISSRRGGGGYVTIIRLAPDAEAVLEELGEATEISERRAAQILDLLGRLGHLTGREARLAAAAVADSAIGERLDRDQIRMSVLRQILMTILCEKE